MTKEFLWFATLRDLDRYYADILDTTNKCCTTYLDTRQAISEERELILSTQSSFITRDLIMSGYDVTLYCNGKVYEVNKNTKIGNEVIKTMKSRKSIEQYCLHDILGLN